MVNTKICCIVVLILGAVLVLIGTLALTYVPNTITNQISKNVHLGFDDNGTYNLMTQRWIEPKYTIQLKIWMLSVVNVEEVINMKAFPSFEEKGPYVFDEHRKKNKVRFMDNNTRVLYRNKHAYIYNSNASCANCSLKDIVTFPNIVFQSFIDIARNSPPAVRKLISIILGEFKKELFTTTTVEMALFNGYNNTLIDALCRPSLLRKLCDDIGIPRRISFFQNATDDGEYLINTGLKGSQEIGKLYSFNGHNKLSWWYSPQAQMINGTDGELFPTGLSRRNTLRFFLGQLGRSLYMRYMSSSVHYNIPCYRYVVPPEVFDYRREENKGFCRPSTPRYYDNFTQPEGCLPAGLFDVGRVKPGSPRVYISAAHFYKSSPVLYENFAGFTTPNDMDQSYVDLEPYTGVVVNAYQTSQINIGLISGGLSFLKGMRDMIVPVLWLNELAFLDEDTKQDLQRIASPARIAFVLGIVTLVLGVLLWAAFLVISSLRFYRQRRADDEENLIEETDET